MPTIEAQKSSATTERNGPAPIVHHSDVATSRPPISTEPCGIMVPITKIGTEQAAAVSNLSKIGIAIKFLIMIQPNARNARLNYEAFWTPLFKRHGATLERA